MNEEIYQIIEQQFPAIYEPELKKEIAEVGKIAHIKAGTVLMEIGQYIKSIPLVVDGSIKVIREDDDGNEIFLYYVESKNTCAMSLTCCMSYSQSKIRAMTEEDTTVINIPVKYMDEWMQKYTSWKNFTMMTYSNRFEELLKTIDLIAFHHMDERLLKYLENKAETLHSDTLNVTHQEIAYDLNSSREAVSRLLKQLEKMGKIKLSRNRIQMVA